MTLVLPLLLAACNPPIPDDTRPIRDDSGTPSPTDSTTPPAPVTHNWVIDSLVVSAGTDGFDLDGDGDEDNALAPLDVVIDPVLGTALVGSERALITQLAGVDDLTADDAVRAALISGVDLDADHSAADNHSGTEPFDGGDAVDAEGAARSFQEVPLGAGGYEAVFPARGIQIGTVEITATTEIHLAGRSVTAASQTGAIGFGVSVDSLTAFAKALGVDAADLDRLAALADIDTDLDGTADTISASFDFHAVSCLVE